MASRISVNVNNFSTPFSTQVNTIAARNEERRLERIYGGPSLPQKSAREEQEEISRAYRSGQAKEALALAHLGTDKSNALVNFGGHSYTLPPVGRQGWTVISSHGNFDAHFGGLGISNSMIHWYESLNSAITRHNVSAYAYNQYAEKQAKGGLFKKKTTPLLLVPKLTGSDATRLFNRKLAQARIPVRLEQGDDDIPSFVHPSSESGDLRGEMELWAKKHWAGIEEKPWNNALFAFPQVTRSVPFTRADVTRLDNDWRDYISQ